MAERVLICGGRDYEDSVRVRAVIQSLPSDAIVIQGGARGVDQLARRLATKYGLHVAEVTPLWDRYGKRAGHLRNAAMLALQPTKVIAFPGGRGTANMVAQAHAAGIPVEQVLPRG